LAHPQFFYNIRHAPNRNTSFGPPCKIETNVHLWITVYTRELNFGQTIWNRGAIGNILGNACGNTLRTWWEHIENRGKKNPKPNLDQGTFEELGWVKKTKELQNIQYTIGSFCPGKTQSCGWSHILRKVHTRC
jgi:hypothetical protein